MTILDRLGEALRTVRATEHGLGLKEHTIVGMIDAVNSAPHLRRWETLCTEQMTRVNPQFIAGVDFALARVCEYAAAVDETAIRNVVEGVDLARVYNEMLEVRYHLLIVRLACDSVTSSQLQFKVDAATTPAA